MEERGLDKAEHEETRRESDVDRGKRPLSQSQPHAKSFREERAKGNASGNRRCCFPPRKKPRSDSYALWQTSPSNMEQTFAGSSEDVDHTRTHGQKELNSRAEVKNELKRKDCQLFSKPERGLSHFFSTLQSHAVTHMRGESRQAENSDYGEVETNRHSDHCEGEKNGQGVRTHPDPIRPELYVCVKEEPLDNYPSTSNYPTPKTHTGDNSPNELAAGLSIRIKQEPKWSGDLPDVFSSFLEEDATIGKDLHPDLSSSRTVRGNWKDSWLKVVLPSERVHSPLNKTHASASSCGGAPQQMPHGLMDINSAHNLRENFTLASGGMSLEDQQQTKTCSDDSNGVTLTIHFQPQQDGLRVEKLYECGMCQVAFELPAQVHEHVTQHDITDRCYVCSRCKLEFPQIAFLTQHVPMHTFSEGTELHYDDPKSFVCHVCSKVFRRLYELNRHQKIHSGLKPFSCNVCRKMFARGDELSRHQKVHSGEKPFSCNECCRAFVTNHELTQHKKNHFVDKPFICSVCHRGFIRPDKLVHHHQMHTGDRPFVCDVCEKGFITASELRQHLKIHSGVKPFVCEVCRKAYLKVNDLKRHMKKHTGLKPFTCDVCGKAFHRTDVLTRHKKTHSKGKRGKKSSK